MSLLNLVLISSADRAWGTAVILLYAGDLFAAFLSAAKLWGIKESDGNHSSAVRYLGFLMTALCFDGICTLVANMDRPIGLHYSAWYAGWFWTGRAVRSAAIWMIALFILGMLPKGVFGVEREKIQEENYNDDDVC